MAVLDNVASPTERALSLVRTLTPFARPHSSYLIRGLLATVAGVVLRVMLPWPMRALLKPWLRDPSHHVQMNLPTWLPADLDPVAVAGGLLLLLMLALGLADMRKRLAYARFSIAVSRDLRAAALRAAGEHRRHLALHRPGDMVTRILGDSARIKTGIRGFLIHITTNVILLSAVSVVLVRLHWGIGLIFVAAVATTVAIALVASGRIAVRIRKIREKEGKLADAIQSTWLDRAADADDYEGLMKASSGAHDAGVTKLQGFAAWSAHVVFGVAMLAAALLAEHEMRIGAMTPSVVLVFVVYALMVRTPLIQMARQGTRLGKVLGSSDRILDMLAQRGERKQLDLLLPALHESITIRELVVLGGRGHDHTPVFGPFSLRIQRGERVYVSGEHGSGKTILLEALAHLRVPESGQILWDEIDYASVGGDSVRERVSYAPSEPSWSKRTLRDLLGIDGEPDDRVKRVLAATGADAVLARLSSGLDAVCISHELSLQERRILALSRAMLRNANLYLFDDVEENRLARVLPTLNNTATVVVTGGSGTAPPGFDRFVSIEKGALVVAT